MDGVILIISDIAGTFRLPLQTRIKWSYVSKIEAIQQHVTHPVYHLYKGGEIKNFTLFLKLAQGMPGVLWKGTNLSEESGVTSFCDALARLALPSKVSRAGERDNKTVLTTRLPSVLVSIGGKKAWMRHKCFVSAVSPEFLPPWSEHGFAMRAEVQMTFIVTHSKFTGTTDTRGEATIDKLPSADNSLLTWS